MSNIKLYMKNRFGTKLNHSSYGYGGYSNYNFNNTSHTTNFQKQLRNNPSFDNCNYGGYCDESNCICLSDYQDAFIDKMLFKTIYNIIIGEEYEDKMGNTYLVKDYDLFGNQNIKYILNREHSSYYSEKTKTIPFKEFRKKIIRKTSYR